MWSRGQEYSWLLFWGLLFALLFCSVCVCPAEEPETWYRISGSELKRSAEISMELERLWREQLEIFEASKNASLTLASDLADTRSKLDLSRAVLTVESGRVTQALSSLTSLGESFDRYKTEALREIDRARRSAGLWRDGAILAAGMGLGALADGPRGALYGGLTAALGVGIYELGDRLRWW